MSEIEDGYVAWLKNQAMGQDRSYDELLDFLYEKTYFFTLRMDENRAEDGIELRYIYEMENGIDDESGLDPGRDCSMLEMMVGLARRCENQIMVDMEEGAQPERWFMVMLTNLGLLDFVNEEFDVRKVNDIIERFLSHRYSYFGEGSLFYVRYPRNDMRKTDLWYQAMWYFTENYGDNNEEEIYEN